MAAHSTERPAKKQSKWSAEENARVIELRGQGMKWDDISRLIPGRSPISCRLHYQNYLERKTDWSEEEMDKFAQLYERFKQDMWQKIADEMSIPWRAAEAKHWQMGEEDMARRAGVVPFSLQTEAPSGNRKASPRNQIIHPHSAHPQLQSLATAPRDPGIPSSLSVYGRDLHSTPARSAGPPLAPRRDTPNAPPPRHGMPESGEFVYSPAPMLPPMQSNQPQRGTGLLPSISELTTGVTYSQGTGANPPTTSRPPSGGAGGFIPVNPGYSSHEPLPPNKRRASDDQTQWEPNQRRRIN